MVENNGKGWSSPQPALCLSLGGGKPVLRGTLLQTFILKGSKTNPSSREILNVDL